MPNIIRHKRSSTSGVVPVASGLSQGELAINIADGKFYTKNSSNVVINLGVSSISGTSITPASGLFSGDVLATGSFIAAVGSAANPSFEFNGDPNTGLFSPAADTIGLATSGVERLRIDSTGKVGIGTDSPAYNLQVNGTQEVFTVVGNDLTTGGQPPTINLKGYTWFGKADGTIGIGAHHTPSTTFGTAGDIYLFEGFDENVTAYNSICLAAGSDPQLFLDTSLNVGIGTATPSDKLHVAGNININGSIRHTVNVPDYVDNIAPITWHNTINDINTDIAKIDVSTNDSSIEGVLVFHTNNGTNLQERVRITEVGNVGIGTPTPTSKLHVIGDISTSAEVAAQQVNIGNDNILNATATSASIIGGLQSKASMYGEIAHAAGGFGGLQGTAQHRILVARGLTLSGAVTVSITSPAVFTRNGHSLSVGDTVKFSTTGALPTGLNTTTNYFVISSGFTANTFRVSTTPTGASVVTSGTQSGTHTLIPSTSLTLNGALGLATPARLVIPERSTWSFTLKISAYSSQNNQGGAWWLNGGLRRNLSATTELNATQGFQYAENSFGAPMSLIGVDADTINDALDIRVTGIVNQSVRWAAIIDIIQVSFGTP